MKYVYVVKKIYGKSSYVYGVFATQELALSDILNGVKEYEYDEYNGFVFVEKTLFVITKTLVIGG